MDDVAEKKTNAEHGAAARAYDCFSYRHYFATMTRSVRLGLDPPYLEAAMARDLDPTSLPPPPLFRNYMSSAVQQHIDALVQDGLRRRDVLTWNATVDQQMEEQEKVEAQKRGEVEERLADEYRQIRSSSSGGPAGGYDGSRATVVFDDAVEE